MNTDGLSDDDWTLRCTERLVELDPALDRTFAEPIALDLCSRPRWRTMAPEDAARAVFDYGVKR